MPSLPVVRSPFEELNKVEDDTLLHPTIMSQAINVLMGSVQVNREFDIPYLAGYSYDRGVIYIDRYMPELEMKNDDDEVVLLDRFLILHETTEKALIDSWRLQYQHAHQIALRVEQSAVIAAGLNWEAYDALMMKHIKARDEQPIRKVPNNLDLTPYVDEGNVPLLQKMYKAMVPGIQPKRTDD
jgi:hypothetical protein